VLRGRAEPQVRHLTAEDRRLLARLGIVVGELVVFSPELLSPRAIERRAALWAARSGARVHVPGGPAVALADDADVGYWYAIGYVPFGPRAIRADLAERVYARLHAATRAGPAALPAEPCAWLACAPEELEAIAEAMGFVEASAGQWMLRPRRTGGRARGRGGRRARVSRAG
jgi:ATP-dependent RNA helicase SUPV3L1/SUV3